MSACSALFHCFPTSSFFRLFPLFGSARTEVTTTLGLQVRTKVLLRFAKTTLHLGNDTSFIILLKVFVLKTTSGLVSSSVPDLSAGTNEY